MNSCATHKPMQCTEKLKEVNFLKLPMAECLPVQYLINVGCWFFFFKAGMVSCRLMGYDYLNVKSIRCLPGEITHYP